MLGSAWKRHLEEPRKHRDEEASARGRKGSGAVPKRLRALDDDVVFKFVFAEGRHAVTIRA